MCGGAAVCICWFASAIPHCCGVDQLSLSHKSLQHCCRCYRCRCPCCRCPCCCCCRCCRLSPQVFNIVPLSVNEWLLVLLFALPVILIDEVLKFLGRRFFGVKHVVPQKRASQVQAAAAAAGGSAANGKLKAA